LLPVEAEAAEVPVVAQVVQAVMVVLAHQEQPLGPRQVVEQQEPVVPLLVLQESLVATLQRLMQQRFRTLLAIS
jgi:hypothetical protein